MTNFPIKSEPAEFCPVGLYVFFILRFGHLISFHYPVDCVF